MSRLIVIPQFPAKLRYQEWWPQRMREYGDHFSQVIFLEPPVLSMAAEFGSFSPADLAIKYELAQIAMYVEMDLEDDDILLLCDLSFPGLFASVLYHKRPSQCYAICHGTSRNKHDYFEDDFFSKWSVEFGYSTLFDVVFVATEYHRKKLGWVNCHVVRFPLPRVHELADVLEAGNWTTCIGSVARPGYQKVDRDLEGAIEKLYGSRIVRFHETGGQTWSEYYSFLGDIDYLLVTSREETYGYQVIDALSVGTVPIAPYALSYPELLPEDCLYEPKSAADAVAVMNRRPACPKLWEDTFIADTTRIMKT